MKQKENIVVSRWFLERIEDTLRIQNNINLDKKSGETCQDRNIKESLNGVRKLLRGEELTGGERLERLQPSLPSNLDDAAKEYFLKTYGIDNIAISEDIKSAVKFGAEWMAGQGVTFESPIDYYDGYYLDCGEQEQNAIEQLSLKVMDKAIVQIRKK